MIRERDFFEPRRHDSEEKRDSVLGHEERGEEEVFYRRDAEDTDGRERRSL